MSGLRSFEQVVLRSVPLTVVRSRSAIHALYPKLFSKCHSSNYLQRSGRGHWYFPDYKGICTGRFYSYLYLLLPRKSAPVLSRALRPPALIWWCDDTSWCILSFHHALTLPMLRLLISKAQGRKHFRNPFKPFHVGIHWNALTDYSLLNTHVPGFQSCYRFLHLFVMAKLAASSIKVRCYKGICTERFWSYFYLLLPRRPAPDLSRALHPPTLIWWCDRTCWCILSLLHALFSRELRE